MRKLLYILIFTTLNNCKAQSNPDKDNKINKQDTIMEVFNIEKFNLQKNNLNQFNFKPNDTTTVNQRELKDQYIEITKTDTSPFEDFKSYHKNGNLKVYVKRFPNSFLKGELKEYDENGKLINQINHDEPFKYGWKDIEEFLENHGVENMRNSVISIRRFNEDKASEYVRKGPYWQLEFRGKYKKLIGQFNIELDGINGEELLVKYFKGKVAKGERGSVADYEILYEKEQ